MGCASKKDVALIKAFAENLRAGKWLADTDIELLDALDSVVANTVVEGEKVFRFVGGIGGAADDENLGAAVVALLARHGYFKDGIGPMAFIDYTAAPSMVVR